MGELKKDRIAIIGSSGLFPGSQSKEEFWQNLLDKKDLTSMAQKEDFGYDPEHFFGSKKGAVDKCYSLRGGYIRDFKFDPNGYHLDATFLAEQDKLYQWSMFACRDSLEDAGYYNHRNLDRCGLVLGNLSFPTTSSHKKLSQVYTTTIERQVQTLLSDESFQLPAHQLNQKYSKIIDYPPSEMVSRGLGLGGTHYTIDAACATSLYAIKLASDELLAGHADLMLAGAVCASDQLFIHMGFSIFHAYAGRDEKFVPLDQASGGLVSSEGAGIVVLKRLSDAERDGDKIMGVIGGIGLSNDGQGKFLLSPNPKGQQLAFERAYDVYQTDPKETSYIECHATGTPLGDKTEINSISDYFIQHQTRPLLGSVKSNMGHLLTAAGMTGLQKVLLAMQHEIIPPNINLKEAVKASNNWIQDEQMIAETTTWSDEDKQAGINSFGFGGTNAHMIVQNYKPGKYKQIASDESEKHTNIAITGMDVHFGNCNGIAEFKNTIFEGKQHFVDLPKNRWKGYEVNKELLSSYGFKNGVAPKGAFIEDFEIDLLRYKIQPKEAETLEPQQALILKVADNAIKDAGLKASQNVAVIIAMESELAIHHYLARWDMSWQLDKALEASNHYLHQEQKEALHKAARNSAYFREGAQTPSQHTSFVGNIMASRIAALWDFSGPAFTVSCGAQSSFKALDIAQLMLENNEVEAVVVGGVDLCGGLESMALRNQKAALSNSLKSSLFTEQRYTGQQIGEGAGAIVLQKSDQVQQRKTYATIHKNTKKTIENCGLFELSTNDHIDFNLFASPKSPIAMGSVQTNIGNTYAAAGIASIIKSALCVSDKFIPAVPNWTAPHEKHNAEKFDIYFPTQSRPWIKGDNEQTRSACVVSNEEQWIISETNSVAQPSVNINEFPFFFLLKGESEKELLHQLSALDIALNTKENARTLSRQFYDKTQDKSGLTMVLLSRSKSQLKKEIAFFQKQLQEKAIQESVIKTPNGSYFTNQPLGHNNSVTYVYPGSATAYPYVGKDLFKTFPGLQDKYESELPNLDQFIWSDYIYPKTQSIDDSTLSPYDNAIALMSVGVFYSAAYTYILKDIFKVHPDMAMGYSMGECSSMWYSLGIWDPINSTVFQDSPIFKDQFAGSLNCLANYWKTDSHTAKDKWISLILFARKESVMEALKAFPEVFLTFINTPTEIIISGDKTMCYAIAAQLNCRSLPLPFQNVIHHDFCKKEEEGLLKMHNFQLLDYPNTKFYSSVKRDFINLDRNAIAINSTEVCCHTVNFPQSVEDVYQKGARIFIELGANATSTNWIKEILKDKEHLAISLDTKGKSSSSAIASALAMLIAHQVDIDLTSLFANQAAEDQKKSFYKKIKLGGPRVDEIFADTQLTHLFKGYQNESAVYSKADTDIAVLSAVSNSVNTITKPTTKKIISQNMESTLAPINKKTDTSKVGENGLRLQNFAEGEQLKGKNIIFSQADLEEFATGKIAKVFGDDYSIIDSYSRRVMLPMYPYLLVSRVTGLQGKKGEYVPSTMQTEYDIPYDAWFTTDRQIPWAVSVESGQCDLLLISYLGIDFENKGNLVYRLLDCTLTFVDDLPFEGQTLRYDISINSFVRNGENLLFFFSYRCYVEDRLVLKMDNGCAGFFKDEQLTDGKGVVYSDSEKQERRDAKKRHFTPLLYCAKTKFNKADLKHLIDGRPELCFEDESYFTNGRNPSLCLPPEKILMIDRITEVNIRGGAYGLGTITAEKDLHPDDWFFPCHFRDDEVLAGSLQAEGGGNLLRFFMLYLGLQRLTKDARYQPIFDLPQKVRCRKQVTPKDTKLVYKLEIKEMGLIPNPYVIGDLEIISDGVVTVHFENLGLQLREKDDPKYLEEQSDVYVSPRSEGALLNEKDITTFALDDLSKCFGPDFSIYDGRKVSRQPNTDLQVISRVLKIDGQRGDFSKPSTIYAEYDVPQDAWYYEQNNAATMPYSILMEVALQPCGLLGAYLGSTLQFPDKNLYFRNLDGEGETFDLPIGTDFRGKTIHNKSVLVSSVALGGTVLQNYTFELSVDGHIFYTGKSSFGFFPPEALSAQAGLDKGKEVPSWLVQHNIPATQYTRINLDSLYGKMKLFKAPENKPHYRLAGDQLLLLDTLTIAKNQGEFGKGYIHASKIIKPYDWFFTCHFYQDPVMPGSLGVEAILQAMQTFALHQDLGARFSSPRFEQVDNHKTNWKYRGQMLTHVENMHLEVHIKSIAETANKTVIIADTYLWNEGMRIYQVTDLAVALIESKNS